MPGLDKAQAFGWNTFVGNYLTLRAGSLIFHYMMPNNPSARAMALRETRRVGAADKVIFGTGDQLGIPTMTSDAKFVRGAAAQGVDFTVILHDPVPLRGQ